MKAEERRKMLASLLVSRKTPVSGSELAGLTQCSRQIIVQDIAILKASGYDILSTNRGYILNKSPLSERVYKVRHSSDKTKDELSLIVSLGGIVSDVFVWHRVYGKIKAELNLFSINGIEKFMEDIKSGKSSELMHITDGYHYHTVKADSPATLDLIEKSLQEKGFLVPEKE